MARFGANNVVVRRRPRRWPIALAALAVPALSLALDNYGVTAAIVGIEALLFFMLPALAIESTPLGEKRVPVLHADREGVTFGKRLVLRREQIASTTIEPLAGGEHALTLFGQRAADDLTVVLPNEERAELMRASLGLTASAACFNVESAPLRAPKTQRTLGLLRFLGALAITAAVIGVTWHHEFFGFTLVPFVLMYYALIRFFRRYRRVTLGEDALVVEAPINIGDLERISPQADLGAAVRTRAGEALDLRFESKEKRDAFTARLQKSMTHCHGDSVAHVSQLVAPAERTRAAWLDDLRKLENESFRGASVPTEDLWRIVENPGADAGARAGAAAALVSRLDAPARVRIGELAEGTAHTELRAALEAAATEDATDEQVVAAYMDDEQ